MIVPTPKGHAVYVRAKTRAGAWRYVGTYPTRDEARRAEKARKGKANG